MKGSRKKCRTPLISEIKLPTITNQSLFHEKSKTQDLTKYQKIISGFSNPVKRLEPVSRLRRVGRIENAELERELREVFLYKIYTNRN